MTKGSKQDLRNDIGWDSYLRLSEHYNPTIQPCGREHLKPSESHTKGTEVRAHHTRPLVYLIYRLVILARLGQYGIPPVKLSSGLCRSPLPRTV